MDQLGVIWRQFGFWRWLLISLIVLEAGLYLALHRRDFSRFGWLDPAFNCVSIALLACLALALGTRFKAGSFDNAFDEDVCRQASRLGLICAGLMFLGGLLLIGGTTLFAVADVPKFICAFLGTAFIFFGLGAGFSLKLAWNELRNRTTGFSTISDDSLAKLVSLRLAFRVNGLLGMVGGGAVLVLIHFLDS